MALNLCKYGGQPKPGRPPTLNVTTGFLCGLFGATHPLCRLFDLGIPTGGGAKTLLQALFKALKALRYLIKAENAIEIGEEGEIETAKFCEEYPAGIELEDINYIDVVSALTPFDNGELMRKLSKIVYITLWGDNCECKAQKDDGEGGGGGLEPSPLPPVPDPTSTCYYGDLYVRQIITQSNNDKAKIARIIDKYPDEPYTVRTIDTSDTPVLVNGFPHPTWLPPNQPGDAEGCMCFARIVTTVTYSWDFDPVLDGIIVSSQQGYFSAYQTLKWCRPPTPPEVPDPVDVFDPDFLENFCDLFPEVEACVKCGGEHLEIDVPYRVDCGESSVITWGIDVVPGSEETF